MMNVIKKIKASNLDLLAKDGFFIIKNFFEDQDFLLKVENSKLVGCFDDEIIEVSEFEDLTKFYFKKWKIEKKVPHSFWGKEMMKLNLVKVKIIEVWDEN